MINKSLYLYLKSPLNTLFGQNFAMKDFFKSLRVLIGREINSSPELAEKLKKIQDGLETCSDKMGIATKQTYFLMHDILDYSMLTKNSNKYVKQNIVFHLPQAIKEVVEILEEKSR